ncbi:MAG: FAD-binding oxidoreductase [Bacteroidales bacterium]|nr:FAD-binding oxidoreductase [Bacteroidales bacterium]
MLTGKYKEFYDKLTEFIPKERMFHDPLTTLAFGTDASFYRLIPKLVVRAYSSTEVRQILMAAYKMDIPVTFRAAGTSLSGQSISDSVLVIATHGFRHYDISVRGELICLEPGVRGAVANRLLSRFGKKIGPDPASIDSAMIGGIAANNASGMCCGTSQNSYKTVENLNIIMPDGTDLDTADHSSIRRFRNSHKQLVDGLENIAKRIAADPVLKERIERKYKIKNTTGYSLNAFVDYSDGIDIIKHLIIGSEGTLAFISNITYRTVDNLKFKGLALVIFPTIREACSAVQVLKEMPVSAVELIDRASIRSVENADGVPQFLKTLPEGACGLLVEITEEDKPSLQGKILRVTQALSPFQTVVPFSFTMDAKEQATLWKVRKECLPTVAGMRKAGTTAIIEDICFPVPRLAEAVTDLRELFDKDGYSDAVLFGHALAGNLHFMFNQDFGNEAELSKYAKLMDDVSDLVVKKYDGSLKAEHGTGRNMAPFVEKEWGEQAYAMMKEIKQLFDPKGILNPGVIINPDPAAHLKNLKPCPPTSPEIDRCMECGFCEKSCVSEGLTFSPRQRVVAYREMARLEKTGTNEADLALIKERYRYLGEVTCATDSLCAVACPVKVDNGKLTKELRHQNHTQKQEDKAAWLAKHWSTAVWGMRAAWTFSYAVRRTVGKKVMKPLAKAARWITGGLIPHWNPSFPNGNRRISKAILEGRRPQVENSKGKVVYFPSCLTRSMGNSKEYKDALSLTRLMDKLIRKAGYDVVYPAHLKKLCCGMAFSSKGFVKAGKLLSDNLLEELNIASEGGKLPIVCDMTPCLYTMKSNFGDKLTLYEPAEFAKLYLMPNLKITKLDRCVAVFAVCTSKKLGVDSTIVDIAKQCARRVKVMDTNCCGFAGDKGFFNPELNDWGLRDLKNQVKDCTEGYATSRTCEVGLSEHSGITFKNLLYLVDEASSQPE